MYDYLYVQPIVKLVDVDNQIVGKLFARMNMLGNQYREMIDVEQPEYHQQMKQLVMVLLRNLVLHPSILVVYVLRMMAQQLVLSILVVEELNPSDLVIVGFVGE